MSRSEKWIKWLLFSGLVLLVLLGQELILGNLRLWGISFFILPMIPAILGSFEGSFEGTVFGLAFGLLCDLMITAPLPCLYTLGFTAAALCSALLAESVLHPGLFCSLLCSALSYAVCGLLCILTFLLRGNGSLVALLAHFLKELILNIPFAVALHFIFLPLHKKCHIYD
ncbi:MAG: hypothetical protein IKU12_07075 [Oscillospiraceae bacterium]|nr:hypothetical protein [Oscillospiraceae bacterium]